MFDMRTLINLNIIYSLFFGSSILLFGQMTNYRRGTNHLGLGVILTGVGFLLVGMRDNISAFMSVIVSNMMIIAGVMLILTGITIFKGLKYRWFIQHVGVFIFTFCLFLYYTYATIDINARIIIVSLVQLVYFVEMIFVLNQNVEETTKLVYRLITAFYVLAFLVTCARILGVIIDTPVIKLFDAGNIHAFSVLIYQLMPFILSVTTFWISNILMGNELRVKAMRDGLTELYNRGAFEELAIKELHRATRYHQNVGLVMGDIDHFKRVNDNYGHLAGDKVLHDIAAILKKNVRMEDIVARYGGEEFVLMIPQVSEEELMAICEKLRQKVENHVTEVDKAQIKCTISLGATVISNRCPKLKNAIAIADIALYDAKNKGRNQVVMKQFTCPEEGFDEFLR